jgi:hypothetical protein
MKTAMQELWDYIKNDKENINFKTYALLRNKIIPLIEKEKEQLMEAVKTGMWETEIPNDLQEYGENYYDSNFGDKVEEAGI